MRWAPPLVGFVLWAMACHLLLVASRAEGVPSSSNPLMPVFEQAAADYRVPLPLLLVLAQMGSGFEDRGGAATIEGGYGLMALRDNAWGGDSLPAAARILQSDPQTLKTDPVLNIRGAAAVLSGYADAAGVDRSAGLAAWEPVLIRFAGLDDQNSRLFAAQAFEKLAAGFTVTTRLGETFRVDPAAVDRPGIAADSRLTTLMSADYPPAIWYPAPSCNYQGFDTGKDTVVIHMAEGTAAGALAYYRDCAAASSMHYVVSITGTVWQMVPESQVAWHAGCYNERAIGIVHEGFSTSTEHPQALYKSSAMLARYLCETWHIPMLRRTDGGPGILGYEQVAGLCGGSAADPGPGWDWPYYLQRIWGNDTGPAIVAAVSSRDHGGAGRFDLSVVGPAVEPRHGGPTRLVVTFDSPISCVVAPATACVAVSSGSVTSAAADDCRLVVGLAGVPDGCRLAVLFPGVVGGSGLPVAGSLCFGVLWGDVNGDGWVGVQDLVKARGVFGSDQALRCDVDVSGVLNSFDLLAIRGRFGRALAAGCP